MLKKRIEPDLIIINVLTLILIFIILVFPMSYLRVIFGSLFILFFPGYILVAALFPKKESISVTTRVALSLVLSVAIAVFIGLILIFTPWGIGIYSLLLSLSLFLLFISWIAWYTRRRVGPEKKFGIDFKSLQDRIYLTLRSAGKQYLSLLVILLCVILVGSCALGYGMAKPAPKQPFTEFYLLDIEGKAENYPQELHPEEEGEVIASIVNHGHEEIDYRLEVTVDGNKLYELPPISLMPEEKWEGILRFSIEEIGDGWKVDFQLHQSSGQPTETRYLWVNVRA